MHTALVLDARAGGVDPLQGRRRWVGRVDPPHRRRPCRQLISFRLPLTARPKSRRDPPVVPDHDPLIVGAATEIFEIGAQSGPVPPLSVPPVRRRTGWVSAGVWRSS